jgi:hypothetical protein
MTKSVAGELKRLDTQLQQLEEKQGKKQAQVCSPCAHLFWSHLLPHSVHLLTNSDVVLLQLVKMQQEVQAAQQGAGAVAAA